MHEAAEKGLEKTIKILLKAGGDPTIEDMVTDLHLHLSLPSRP